jgi:hypothetical protein
VLTLRLQNIVILDILRQGANSSLIHASKIHCAEKSLGRQGIGEPALASRPADPDMVVIVDNHWQPRERSSRTIKDGLGYNAKP